MLGVLVKDVDRLADHLVDLDRQVGLQPLERLLGLGFMYWIFKSRSAYIMLTGAFSTICLIRFSSPWRASLETLSEASWPMIRSASSRAWRDLHGLRREEVERADHLAVAHDRQGDRRS